MNRRLFEGLSPTGTSSSTHVFNELSGKCDQKYLSGHFSPVEKDAFLEIFAVANNPQDPFELRDLTIARAESQQRYAIKNSTLVEKWLNRKPKRDVTWEEILSSRHTVRFIKELFNFYFRDDLYGKRRSDQHLILSSGSLDEDVWGLSEVLKSCLKYALDQDWYGYSDPRGRQSTLEAIAAYENTQLGGSFYDWRNVSITMGATFAINALTDFLFLEQPPTNAPALCAIPNYPPLVESIARRSAVELVPLPIENGVTSLDPLICALRFDTPLVMLQTVANPTGTKIAEPELARLIQAASPSTMILLDECHECLGETFTRSSARTRSNVIRVSSLSKTWSAPGAKIGWIVADKDVITDYYEYASTSFGGPPSLFYTLIEVLCRMERWLLEKVESVSTTHLAEFEDSYGLEIDSLNTAYRQYVYERKKRETGLIQQRNRVISVLAGEQMQIIEPHYSINMLIRPSGWSDSYTCYRDLLHEAEVATYPAILNFCFGDGVRITPARRWETALEASKRIATVVSAAE